MRVLAFRSLAVLTLAGCLAPVPAWAWKQTLVQSGCGERWKTDHLTYSIEKQGGGLQGILDEEYETAVKQAFEAWQGVSCEVCATGKANEAPKVCKAHPVGFTAEYLGLGDTDVLGPACVQDVPSAPCQIKANGNFVVAVHDKPLGNNVVSFTVITANVATGEIIDADIALDAGTHDFCVDVTPPGDVGACKIGYYDLRSTLTHEVGHFLGLDHSLDTEATMFVSAPAQETKKSTLEQDDRAGLCHAYSTTCDPASLPKPGADAGGTDAGGKADAGQGGKQPDDSCQASRHGQGVGPLLLLLAVVAALRRRRWASCPG